LSPRWGLLAEPHYVLKDDTDLSLGMRYNAYADNNVLLLIPKGHRPFSDSLSLGAQIYFAFTPEVLAASHLYIDIHLSPTLSMRSGISGGQTLEGLNLKDRFWDIILNLKYRGFVPLLINMGTQIYRGNLRSETRIGGGLEWLF
jgi:hypothetical protein